MANCNFCKSELTNVFCDLGFQPPSNFFLTKDQLEQPEVYYPLKAYVCEKCFLVQVPETKKAADIFNEDYVYFSSESPANVQHAKEFVDEMYNRFNPKTVLEIGSNDGYMLQWWDKKPVMAWGLDPSRRLCEKAREKGCRAVHEPFSAYKATDIFQADFICGINVLAHQPDINDFVEGIRIALKPDGVAVFEFPWLLKLVENVEWDTIYLEHFSYFSMTTLMKIFSAHELEIFDVDKLNTHGGSLRIYVRHASKVNNYVSQDYDIRKNSLLCLEGFAGADTINFYLGFNQRIQQVRRDFMEFIYSIPNDKVIVAYGAAAKGNTFMNYCGVKSDLIPLVVDRSPHKQDKYLPGSHIFVTNEEDGIINLQPDYVLILAWNLKAEIMEQLKYIRSWGGKFVVAIPNLEIL